jgi:glycosyltransferase involved in cell wall biosynthesis
LADDATSAGGSSVSVVIPCYNESTRLLPIVEGYRSLASMVTELVFVDDGSTDDTRAVLDELVSRPGLESARVLQLGQNCGKGGAVAAGVRLCTGDRIVFMDADLAADIADLPRLLGALDDHDIAIGSRAAPGHQVLDAAWHRGVMGRTFNRLVRRYTGLEISDTQCGFKAFRGDVARRLFTDLNCQDYAFDVEVLYRARRLGHSVAEVPVRWTAIEGSHVRVVRDSFTMLREIRRLTRSDTLERITTVDP